MLSLFMLLQVTSSIHTPYKQHIPNKIEKLANIILIIEARLKRNIKYKKKNHKRQVKDVYYQKNKSILQSIQ